MTNQPENETQATMTPEETTMSKHPEHEKPQPEGFTPQELREALLAELEARRHVIAELNERELTGVQGGAWEFLAKRRGTHAPWELGAKIESSARERVRTGSVLTRTQSAPPRLETAPFRT